MFGWKKKYKELEKEYVNLCESYELEKRINEKWRIFLTSAEKALIHKDKVLDKIQKIAEER